MSELEAFAPLALIGAAIILIGIAFVLLGRKR